MAVQQLQVFLASSFDEFSELRKVLAEKIRSVKAPRAAAIDLNDNYPDSLPPIERCRESIDSADIVVLLIGKTYGTDAEDGTSYTHLEYLHAQKRGKVILTYLIGKRYSQSTDYRPDDRKLRQWIDDIFKVHCASGLDPDDGWEKLGMQIADTVRDYLLEVADAEGMTYLAADAFEGWEESPVGLHELLPQLKGNGRAKRLRSLAADHAEEALQALELNLPHIAIGHLQRAFDLVPLEPVTGYWLARLQLASDVRREWRKARIVAIGCVGIATALKNGVPNLLRMACWIVAARTSERLGERGAALQHAMEAHSDSPFHWLAKLELGRQLALDGRVSDAFGYAYETFWLKPGAIYRIHADTAFFGLGEAYHRFRRELRTEVSNETEAVLYNERRLVEFVNDLGLSETQPIVRQPNTGSLLSMINTARVAARRSLQLIRQCTSKLIDDCEAFRSGQHEKLTIETAGAIQRAIASEQKAVAALKSKLAEVSTTEHHYLGDALRSAFFGFVVIVMVALGIELKMDDRQLTALIAVLGSLSFAGLSLIVYGSRARMRDYVTELEATRLQHDLKAANERLSVAAEAASAFEHQLAPARAHLRRLCDLVNEFERTAAKRLAYAPAVPPHRENTTDAVRIKSDDDKIVLPRDTNLLPGSLAALIGDPSPVVHTRWLACRIKTNDGEVFSRRAAYFAQ